MLRRLDDITPAHIGSVGAKAASLAALRREGFKVPDGLVVCVEAFDVEGRLDPGATPELMAMARALSATHFAVRSSGVSEDRPDASFAGQYLTLLDVPIDELVGAAERVNRSGRDGSVRAYLAPPGAVGVLVQPMVEADAAGVAFTADPLSGARDVVVVHAVRGLGVRLVDGSATGAEWRVRGDNASRTTAGDAVLTSSDALRIADVARHIARLRGAPQDIEWAISREALHVLQARPMTALSDTLTWSAPAGVYARHFRLGEWLGDPVTPLFESWLLSTMEHTMHANYARLVGQPAPSPLHVVVNGWYYYSLNFLPASPSAMLRMLPGVLVRLARDFKRIAPVFPPLARFGIDLFVQEWREQHLPRYRDACAKAVSALDTASAQETARTIDELAVLAGHYFTSMTFVAGYGWKTEIPLARFYRRHLTERVGGHPYELLRGLTHPSTPGHAVQSLDWWFPTLHELAPAGADEGSIERHATLVRGREDLERRARLALEGRRRAQFDGLLAEAQRAAILREEQVRDLTLAWPCFRRALLRLGTELVTRGMLRDAESVYFLTRRELDAAIAGDTTDRRPVAAERRAMWERHRRLVAPLVLGTLPPLLRTLLGEADRAVRDPDATDPHAVRGTPASPGRATGPARVLRDSGDFAKLRPGDVLVCPVTTPAWTHLFAIAAAVVTDVGSPAAHASIIAREFGIPAIVGTGDSTSRLRDGELVTVDGGKGLVLPAGSGN